MVNEKTAHLICNEMYREEKHEEVRNTNYEMRNEGKYDLGISKNSGTLTNW